MRFMSVEDFDLCLKNTDVAGRFGICGFSISANRYCTPILPDILARIPCR